MSSTLSGSEQEQALAGFVARDGYTSEAVYAAERERIWTRTWQLVCHERELTEAGAYVTADVAGQSVVVVRDEEGTLRAFYNSCSHRGAQLAPAERGRCDVAFKCMYHGWAFDLEGNCVGVPYRRAYPESFKTADYGLTAIPIDTFAGLVFVALKPKVPSLADFLGESGDYIRQLCNKREIIGRAQFEFEGNWKLWHDNFADNYHPEFSHRIVRDLTPNYADRGSNQALTFGHGLLRWPSPAMDLEKYRSGLKNDSGWDIDLLANPAWSWVPHATFDADVEDMVLTVFPNLSVESFYGGAFVVLQAVTPIAVDKSVVRSACLGDIGESAEARQRRLAEAGTQIGSWGKVAADDTEAMVRAQRGLGSSREFINMQRGAGSGTTGATRDEFSMREFHVAIDHYMSED